jgi:6-phosphogluconolactonase
MGTPDLRVVEDPASACAEELLQVAGAGGDIVLTGGSTPRSAYELAARSPERFEGARLWFGDERCVGPDDERSNYRMVREALLDPLAAGGVELDFCERMAGELGPDEGAARYEQALAQRGAPPFALLLLGIGPDGHTASMFPGQDSLQERERLVVGVQEAGFEPFVPRISFTFACIAQAEHVLVLATGEKKAQAVARAFGPDARPEPETPSSFLPQFARRLTVLLDSAAAALL